MSVPVAEQETHTHTHEREVFSQTFGIMSDRERERVRKGLKVGLPISGRAVAPLFLLLWLRESWRNFRRPFSLSLSLSLLSSTGSNQRLSLARKKKRERERRRKEKNGAHSHPPHLSHTLAPQRFPPTWHASQFLVVKCQTFRESSLCSAP